MFKLVFNYDKKGFGNLLLTNDTGKEFGRWPARCGSRDKLGRLVNATPTSCYRVFEPTISTEEGGMVRTPGCGWKARMWRQYAKNTWRYEHILIHPDGGQKPNDPIRNGTKGCIGTFDDALGLRAKIDELLKTQKEIFIEVGRVAV